MPKILYKIDIRKLWILILTHEKYVLFCEKIFFNYSLLIKYGFPYFDIDFMHFYNHDLSKIWFRERRENRERRVGQNVASALQKLQSIKDYYSEAGRPR